MRNFWWAFFLSLPVWAGVQGSWKGQGTAKDTDSFHEICPVISLNVEVSETRVSLANLLWDCSGAGYDWGTLHYRRVGNKLFQGVEEVGSYEENRIALKVREFEFPTLFTLELNAEGNLHYQEEWQGKSVQFFVEGTLQRISSN